MSESRSRDRIASLDKALTDNRKAVLQRFLIERICDKYAKRTFHARLFSDTAIGYDKPLSFSVEHLLNWIGWKDIFLERLNLNSTKLSSLTNGLSDGNGSTDVDRRVLDHNSWIQGKYTKSSDRRTYDDMRVLENNISMQGEDIESSDRKIVFSKLDDFEFVRLTTDANDMYETNPNTNEIGRRRSDLTSHITKEVHDYSVANNLRYSGLDDYIGSGYIRINGNLRLLYNGSKIDDYSITQIQHALWDFEIIETIMLHKITDLKAKLINEHFFVYRGGRAPWVGSSDDIYTASLPFTFTCTAFLSTSVDYKVARDFLEINPVGNLIWKLKVATCSFALLASTGNTTAKDENEVLFRPGQRIEITSISMNEDGIQTMHGTVVDYVDHLPKSALTKSKKGGGQSEDKFGMYLPKQKKGTSRQLQSPDNNPLIDTEEPDVISRLLMENENRDGSKYLPFLLVTPDDERMISVK